LDAPLTDLQQNGIVESRSKTEDEIKKAEQHEVLKQAVLRLLDDPQIQQKVVSILRSRLGALPKQ
jgi:hypothetical protein